ncbi:MAG TPA: nucleoside 2-deoxyribosyltransferase [Candidatus Dojkabacteria bacterium]|nr:nucleoside 2-deoxyribosyltransferase [Candidatus Dojkabacteria bacterium]
MCNNRLPVVYFAHPISGVSLEVVQQYYDDIRKMFGKICFVQTPMDVVARTDLSERKESFKDPAMVNDVITNRDYKFVEGCNVIFANLSKCTRVSIGTVMEIAWAYAHHKYIIIVMDKEGLHEHGMILGTHPVVFTDFNSAAQHLVDYCMTGISDPDLRDHVKQIKQDL